MSYVVTITEMESGNIRQSSSYLVEKEEEDVMFYAQGRVLPAVVGRNISFITSPTSWTVCVHVITKIS